MADKDFNAGNLRSIAVEAEYSKLKEKLETAAKNGSTYLRVGISYDENIEKLKSLRFRIYKRSGLFSFRIYEIYFD